MAEADSMLTQTPPEMRALIDAALEWSHERAPKDAAERDLLAAVHAFQNRP